MRTACLQVRLTSGSYKPLTPHEIPSTPQKRSKMAQEHFKPDLVRKHARPAPSRV